MTIKKNGQGDFDLVLYLFPRKPRLTEFARVMLWVARKAGMLSPAGDPGSMVFPQNHAICCLDSGAHTPVRSQFSVCLFVQALGKQVPTCWILVLSGSFPKAAAGVFCGFQNIFFLKNWLLPKCLYVCGSFWNMLLTPAYQTAPQTQNPNPSPSVSWVMLSVFISNVILHSCSSPWKKEEQQKVISINLPSPQASGFAMVTFVLRACLRIWQQNR